MQCPSTLAASIPSVFRLMHGVWRHRTSRRRGHPVTPDKTTVMSKRAWDGRVKVCIIVPRPHPSIAPWPDVAVPSHGAASCTSGMQHLPVAVRLLGLPQPPNLPPPQRHSRLWACLHPLTHRGRLRPPHRASRPPLRMQLPLLPPVLVLWRTALRRLQLLWRVRL